MTPTSSRFSSKSKEFPGNSPSKRPSPSALLSLVAIGIVIILVALPSLRGFALHENEADAVRVLRALGHASREQTEPTELSIGQLFSGNPELQHRFGDLEYLEDFELLRTHGYLFDLVVGEDGPTLRAWPWAFGRTGRTAFCQTADGVMLGHANENGAWSGTSAVTSGAALEASWRKLR